MLERLVEWNPDVLHVNSLILEPVIAHLQRVSSLARIAVVASVRESPLGNLPRGQRQALRTLHRYVCIAPVVAEHLVAALGPEVKNRTVVVSNLTSEQQFEARAHESSISVDSRDVVLAFIGRLEPWKGPHRVAAAYAAAAIPNTRLVFIGGGRHPLALIIRAFAALIPRALYLGEVSRLTASSTYECIDVVVRADSEYLGLGRVGAEALKAHKILVLPDPHGSSLTEGERNTPAIVWTPGRGIGPLIRAMRIATERAIEARREPPATAPTPISLTIHDNDSPSATYPQTCVESRELDSGDAQLRYVRSWLQCYDAAASSRSPNERS